MRRASVRATALALAGGLALAGCASDDGDSGGSSSGGSEDGLKIGLAYDAVGRGDRSYNDSAFAGASAAIDDLGGDLQEFTPNEDGSDRAEGLANLAEQGYDPVIAVGFAYGDTIAEVAADFPDTTFAVVDSSVAELGLSNATGLVFAEEQGAFLAGVAAALKSPAGHVGFVGGQEAPLIQKFEAGFTAGARAVNPAVRVDVQYISPAGDFSGFNAPDRAEDIADVMYGDGAEVVFHAAGGSGTGVFAAAVTAGKLAIGVDSDQYNTVDDEAQKAVILTSMLKRVDIAVQSFITDFDSGSVEGGTDILNDLSTEGIALSTSGGQIDDIQTQIADYTDRIIAGEIDIPTTP
jgi:basic membrane protein A